MHAELRAHHHERVRHVVLRVAHEHELEAARALRELLFDRHQVGDHLRGVELGGEPVPHRDARVFGELLDDLLAVSAVLDAVEHAAEHARGVGDRLLLAHLRSRRVEVGDAHAQVMPGDLKRAAGAGRGLLEQQHDVLALEVAVRRARELHALELVAEADEVADLFGGEIEQLQEAATAQAYGHGDSFRRAPGAMGGNRRMRPGALSCAARIRTG